MGREDMRNESVLRSSLSFPGVPGAPENLLCCLDIRLCCAELNGNYYFPFTRK
jgi:hypothetical protein